MFKNSLPGFTVSILIGISSIYSCMAVADTNNAGVLSCAPNPLNITIPGVIPSSLHRMLKITRTPYKPVTPNDSSHSCQYIFSIVDQKTGKAIHTMTLHDNGSMDTTKWRFSFYKVQNFPHPFLFAFDVDYSRMGIGSLYIYSFSHGTFDKVYKSYNVYGFSVGKRGNISVITKKYIFKGMEGRPSFEADCDHAQIGSSACVAVTKATKLEVIKTPTGFVAAKI